MTPPNEIPQEVRDLAITGIDFGKSVNGKIHRALKTLGIHTLGTFLDYISGESYERIPGIGHLGTNNIQRKLRESYNIEVPQAFMDTQLAYLMDS